MIRCRSRCDFDSWAEEGCTIWVCLIGVLLSWPCPKVSGSNECDTVPLNFYSMFVWACLLPKKIMSLVFAWSSSVGSTVEALGFVSLLAILIFDSPTFLF